MDSLIKKLKTAGEMDLSMPKISINEINNAVENDINTVIDNAEKNYSIIINGLVNTLCSNKEIMVVLLAGPSASGKTTTANILKDRLILSGHNSVVISLDNFYKNKNNYPLKPDGTPDYENVSALDIDEIHVCLADIINKGKAYVPKFNFKEQRRDENKELIEIGKDGFVIVEGIHALNPIISEGMPRDSILKVFVSVSTGITNDEKKEILSGKNIRFLRRLTRDYLYRGADAEMTLDMWPDVLLGEEKYLYPYKQHADFKINTFHLYEVGAVKDLAIEVMGKDEADKNSPFFKKVYSAVNEFKSVPMSLIPDTSLLKEFIPGGIYEKLY